MIAIFGNQTKSISTELELILSHLPNLDRNEKHVVLDAIQHDFENVMGKIERALAQVRSGEYAFEIPAGSTAEEIHTHLWAANHAQNALSIKE